MVFCGIFMFCASSCFKNCGIGLRLYESEYFICSLPYDSNDINILGLTEKGMEQEYLVVPERIDGKRVNAIGCTTGLATTKIKEKYGDAKYAQIKSSNLKKMFIKSKIVIRGFGLEASHPFVDCPNLEGVFYISNEYEYMSYKEVYRTSYLPFEKNANVSYYYNYKNAPNDGYYWIDNYTYGDKIDYIPEIPIRGGYTFNGWYKDSECIYPWDFEVDKTPDALYDEQGVEVYQETKLYAKWSKD